MYHRPKSLEEALDAVARGGGRLLSGGTDVFPALDGPRLDEAVIDLSQIDSLRGIATAADGIRIGARTTWTDLLKAPLPRGFDGLKAAAREVGVGADPERRHDRRQPLQCLAGRRRRPPLLALDAEVELASPRGRRALPLESFFTRQPPHRARPGRDPRRDPRAAHAGAGARRVPQARRAALSRHLHRHGRGRARCRRSRPCRGGAASRSAPAPRWRSACARSKRISSARAPTRPRRGAVGPRISPALSPDRRRPRPAPPIAATRR